MQTDDVQNAPSVWPPAPTLGPPSPAPRSKLLPLWFVILVSILAGALFAVLEVLQQWSRHQSINWYIDALVGLCVFAVVHTVQVLGRHRVRRQEIKAAGTPSTH